MSARARLLLACLLLLPLQPPSRAQDPSSAHPLTLAARVWGLAKYFHPSVTACAVDWDQALMDSLPALEAAGADRPARDAALLELLDRAGDSGQQAPGAATPDWIRQADVGDALRARLAWLAARQPQQQCYLEVAPFADFSNDAGHDVGEADRPHRALAAFRFWNVIEYFFPYKADIQRDWSAVLDQHLRAVLDAADTGAYVRAMRALTAAIEDSHAGFGHPAVPGLSTVGQPPFQVRTVEGRPIVVQVRAEAGPVRPGDEVLRVDGETVAARKQAWDPMGFGSNPVSRDALNLRRALGGTSSPGRFLLRRPDGSEYELELPRSQQFFFASAGGIAGTWETRELEGGCRMGIVDMARLQPAEVPAMLAELAGTDAIVFDIRNYPNGTLWPIADRLYPEPRAVALFERPSAQAPGRFVPDLAPIGGASPAPFAGRLLVLFDERSISQAEYTVMGLQAVGNTLTFGSQTAAADGNVTWVDLPGGLRAVFTGLGVYYPDGTPTQRIGMVPDVHVTPTIAGLAAGRDEVLDAALDCRWTDQSPTRRMPGSGLYFDPERSGEGLDLHHDGTLVAALSYGYDDAGESTWLLAGAPATAADWGSRFLRYRDGGQAWDAAADHVLDFHRGPYQVACASTDQGSLHPRGHWRWPGGPAGGRCALPLLRTGASQATGLYAGPTEELGWGLSVHHADGQLTVYVYAYDGEGAPRWLLGQAPWDGSGTIDLPLQRVTGFCRSCPAQPPLFTPAGTLTLHLDGPGGEDDWVTLDARFTPASPAWRRDRMPLQRLVGPSG